jgi:NADPH-dependent 2,4-dienoyl-CoA reductase/sulfur reductase-like enzyme/nitrite reductase/ring-hydroxylating ferredoxin subunit
MQAVARLSDLPENGVVKKTLGDTDIVLVRSGQTVRAYGGNCPHAGAPLDGGAVCNGRLICPWHKAEFAIEDGTVLEPPALDNLTRFPLRLDGEDVLVSAGPAQATSVARAATGRLFAIVGSGAAGTAAAVELRRLGFDGRILLIGPEALGPYDRTALSKFVLSGEMMPDDVPLLREPGWWTSHDVERLCAVASRVDAAAKRIHLADGSTIAYDAALVATGAVARRPTLPGAKLPGALTLRDAQDAAAIVSAAASDARVVVIGSSFIGLEAASALRRRDLPVTVVAPDGVPFARQFGPEIGGMFRRLHEANGVAFRLETAVESIQGTDRVQSVVLKGGQVLPADLVLIGVGVAPATDMVDGVEKDKDGGIVVGADGRAADGLFAAGDCAAFPLGEDHVRIEHWRVAQQHGRVAGGAMLGRAGRYDGVPFFWTYHYGKRFEYLGHAKDWDSLQIDGDLDSQDFIALQIKQGNVVGVIACQRERTTAVLIARMRRKLPQDEALSLMRA